MSSLPVIDDTRSSWLRRALHPATTSGLPDELRAELLAICDRLASEKREATRKHVLVVPGILGTSLDDVDAGGAEHPLWIAPLRLLETPDMLRLRMQVGATYQEDRDLDPSACVRAKAPLELVRFHGLSIRPRRVTRNRIASTGDVV